MSAIEKKAKSEVIIPLTIAVIITLFLFYIDEGYYNFNWMLDFGNWFVFVIYVSVLFSIFWLIMRIARYFVRNN